MIKRRTAFLYTDDFLAYDLGPRHPLQQERLQRVYRLLDAYGAFAAPGGPIDWREPPVATRDEILRVHTPEYLSVVLRASRGERGEFLRPFGLGPGDTPAFDGLYPVAALYAGGTVEAARLVLSGEYDAAFSVAGGLHHAHPNRASGFCTFNDIAIGIHELLRGGLTRVIYVDIDAHHGDGIQACFYDDPRVMTISLHESGQFLFPRTGLPGDTGVGEGDGYSVNISFHPFTQDDVWHRAFDRFVPAAFDRFRPEAVVLQIGADAHWQDPLTHLLLTSQGWMRAIDKLLDLTGSLPLILTGGGGYNKATVARLWAMATAHAAGVTLPDEIPEAYATEYGITHLHDRQRPQIEAAVRSRAESFMEEQAAVLEDALGWQRDRA